MKIYSLLLCALFFSAHAFSQIVLKLSSVTANKSDNVSVELRVDNFTKIQSTAYAIRYDTTLLEYQSITDFAQGYADISIVDPISSGKKGLINTIWNNANGETNTYPNNSMLFKMNFKLIGNPCDSGFTKIVKGLIDIEFINENGDKAPYTLIDGKVKVNGPNCQSGGGGGTDSSFTFIASQIEVPKGTNGCIKVTAKNFKLINSFQGNLKWDKAIARYTGITSTKINGILVDISSDSTFVRFLWDDPQGKGVTLADNSVLFEACFDAVGAVNSTTAMSFVDVPLNNIEVYGGGVNSDVVPHKITNDSYKVIGSATTVNLYMRDTSGTLNNEVCVPIYVSNFKCVETIQFAVKFSDNVKLKFNRFSNIALPGFNPASNAQVSNDSIRVTWDNNGGAKLDLNDGSVLMNLCFQLNGPCDMTVPLKFIDLSNNGPIDVSGCNDPYIVKTTNANLTISCALQPVQIVYTSGVGSSVSCPGSCDGTITTSVTGGSGNFTYLWLDSNNQPIVPNITTKDATGLCPGRYKLQVTDVGSGNMVTRGTSVEIKDASPIIVTGTVTHVTSAGNDGMIDVSVSGGTPGFTYKWKRLPNSNQPETTNKISNKPCGNYEVTVTDSKNCVVKDTFRIECYTQPPTCTMSVVDSIKCNGDCTGSLKVDVNFGAIPFKYKWSTSETTITIKNLCAGTYTVTVSDAKDSTCTASYTFNQPEKIGIVVSDSTCAQQNTSTGANNINVTGGTKPYQYEWRQGSASGSIVSTTEDLANVAAGQYYLKVTDKNGCTNTYLATITTCPVTGKDPTVVLNVDPKNGAGTTCKGTCDGKITAVVSDGKQPFTYKWSHNGNLNSNIADNLCAGTYTVTVTDANQKTAKATTTVTEPSGLVINFRKIGCASNNLAKDGQYEAVISGGTKPYTYQWCNNETGNVASALEAGTCSITVTDANGCSQKETFTVCNQEAPKGDCFKGRLAISPNGDGLNDNLEISCILDYENSLHIYDRWGNLVWSAIDYTNQFVGIDKDGNRLNEGTYMYVLVIKQAGKNDEVYKGTVTIVR